MFDHYTTESSRGSDAQLGTLSGSQASRCVQAFPSAPSLGMVAYELPRCQGNHPGRCISPSVLGRNPPSRHPCRLRPSPCRLPARTRTPQRVPRFTASLRTRLCWHHLSSHHAGSPPFFIGGALSAVGDNSSGFPLWSARVCIHVRSHRQPATAPVPGSLLS